MHAGKQAAALAALEFVRDDTRLGIGTGSTVDHFIDALAEAIDKRGLRLEGAVSSSEQTSRRLRAIGLDVLDLNMTGELDLYVDGADEADDALCLIKGGGGALTREKIIATASREFVCLVDDSKRVSVLGEFGVPIEVIPMARSHVARQIVRLGADPEYREGARTDNGNVILDCYGFRIDDPLALETTLDGIAGVVASGLFARRPADRLITGFPDGRTESATAALP